MLCLGNKKKPIRKLKEVDVLPNKIWEVVVWVWVVAVWEAVDIDHHIKIRGHNQAQLRVRDLPT